MSLWEIERLLLGELQGPEADALRRKVEATPHLKAYMEKAKEGPHRDFKDLQRLKRERAAAVKSAPAAIPAASRPGSSSLEWINSLTGRLIGLRLAYGLAFAALVGVALWRFHPGQEAVMESRFQAKGGDEMEILLKVGGREIEAGESLPAKAGDTLGFSYRTQDAKRVEIWYREDGGELSPFAEPEADGPAWTPATRWTAAPQRILLEGSWKRQEVWVICSRRALSRAEIKSLVEGRKEAQTLGKAWVFRLVQEGASP